MNDRIALPLLVTGTALVAMAAMLLVLQGWSAELAALDPRARLMALGPTLAASTSLTVAILLVLRQGPAITWRRALAAAAAGAWAAIAIAASAPAWLTSEASTLAWMR